MCRCNCDTRTLKAISNSLDIDFIYGHIHDRTGKKTHFARLFDENWHKSVCIAIYRCLLRLCCRTVYSVYFIEYTFDRTVVYLMFQSSEIVTRPADYPEKSLILATHYRCFKTNKYLIGLRLKTPSIMSAEIIDKQKCHRLKSMNV